MRPLAMNKTFQRSPSIKYLDSDERSINSIVDAGCWILEAWDGANPAFFRNVTLKNRWVGDQFVYVMYFGLLGIKVQG
jgi:hypothetical protein